MNRRTFTARATATAAAVVAGPALAPTAVADPPEQPATPDKSIAFYVGKNRAADGQTLLGGFGHEPSSHWLEIVPRQQHPDDATISVGATSEADLPGELTEIPQADETAKYITSNYSEFAGFPAPLTNGGLNENNVAARDVWSTSRDELIERTPDPQTGPSYSDLSRIAMERATSARDAVEILGGLIDEHGYTTYGGNSHLFADENEGWVFIEFAGGEGLWAAERLGPDDVRVSYPGYIQDFPVEPTGEDYLGSDNLVDFAVEQGWFDDEGAETINLQEVYGTEFPTEEFDVGEIADPDDPSPYRNPVSLEAELDTLAPVTLQDMMRLVRDPRWSDDRSGYGHVAELRDDLAHPDLATLWVASTASVTAPYFPIPIGATNVPIEYAQHRYLTQGASSEFLDPEFAEQEATEYATQTYKRLMYATCARPETYLGQVTTALEGFEAESLEQWPDVVSQAEQAYADGNDDDARSTLTAFTESRALDGLALGNYLLDDILQRSRDDGGIQAPDVDVPEGTTASERSMDMAMRGEEAARDRMYCDVGGGWPSGDTLDRQGEYGDPDDVPDYDDTGDTPTTAEEQPTAAGTDSSTGGQIALGVFAGVVLLGLGTALLTRRRQPHG